MTRLVRHLPIGLVPLGSLVFYSLLVAQTKPEALRPSISHSKPGVVRTPTLVSVTSGPADAKLTVEKNANGSYYGFVDSGGTQYSSPPTDSFIVDISIPNDFKFPDSMHAKAIRVYAQDSKWSQVTQSGCHLFSLRWQVFRARRNIVTQKMRYESLAAEQKKGVWTYAADIGDRDHCDLGFCFRIPIPPTPVPGFGWSYRVLVKSKISGGSYRPVSVGWQWSY